MQVKIGVMGSSEKPKDPILIEKAREIGREIARQKCILINGATTGMPDEAARGTKEMGGMVIGISPARNLAEHHNKFKLPSKNYDTIIYTGFGFNLRNIVNVRTSDALIFIRGSLGTLNEFTIAYEDGKIIGVLEKTGGISDFFDELIQICKKQTEATIIHDSDPQRLVKKVYDAVIKRNK